MRNDKENLIVKLTFEMAIDAIKFTEELESMKKYALAKQLIRSAISVGANTREAQNAESTADFIHKLKIAAKELDETKYYLEICEKMQYYPYNSSLMEKVIVIERVLSKIISTTKQKAFSNRQISKPSN